MLSGAVTLPATGTVWVPVDWAGAEADPRSGDDSQEGVGLRPAAAGLRSEGMGLRPGRVGVLALREPEAEGFRP